MNNINLNLLPVHLDEDIVFPESYYQDTDIIRIDNLHIVGDIFYNLSDEIETSIHVSGDMILQDAITLEEIVKNIAININETIEKNAKYYEKEQNTLDKLEFLWENIVLEIPISLTNNSGVNLKGDGWELNPEDEESINPDFAKLKDIFKGGE